MGDTISIYSRVVNRLPRRADAAIIANRIIDGMQRGARNKVFAAEAWAFSQLRVFADFRTSRPATVPRSHLGPASGNTRPSAK
jgi:hypothetical protein